MNKQFQKQALLKAALAAQKVFKTPAPAAPILQFQQKTKTQQIPNQINWEFAYAA